MIRTFRDKDTENLFAREGSRRLPPNLQRITLRKLLLLDAAASLADLRVPPGNRSKSSNAIALDNIVYGSTTAGGFAFAGVEVMHMMSKLSTTTRSLGWLRRSD